MIAEPSGTVLFADAGVSEIRQFTPDATVTTMVGSRSSVPPIPSLREFNGQIGYLRYHNGHYRLVSPVRTAFDLPPVTTCSSGAASPTRIASGRTSASKCSRNRPGCSWNIM